MSRAHMGVERLLIAIAPHIADFAIEMDVPLMFLVLCLRAESPQAPPTHEILLNTQIHHPWTI